MRCYYLHNSVHNIPCQNEAVWHAEQNDDNRESDLTEINACHTHIGLWMLEAMDTDAGITSWNVNYIGEPLG